jgi:hypothetical protein
LPLGKWALAVLAAMWTLASGALGSVIKSEGVDRLWPPTTTVKITELDYQAETFGEYLSNTNADRSKFDSKDFDRPGLAVFSTVEATGLKGDRLMVKGGVLDVDNGARELTDLGRWLRSYVVVPGAATDTEATNIWVALPEQPGRYRVVERVYEDREGGEFLMRAKTEDFIVDARGRVTKAPKD